MENTLRKSKWLWSVLGSLILIGMAFWFFNFRASVSNTQSDKTIIKTSLGEELPYPIQRREKISIIVDGDSLLDRLLRGALEVEMKRTALVEIEAVKEPAHTFPNPVMVIKVSKPVIIWTPFLATSQFSVQTSYASTGDTIFIGDPPLTLDNKNGPALTMSAEYKIQDRSWGLISRPGYHQLLADYLAKNIIATLKDLYQGV